MLSFLVSTFFDILVQGLLHFAIICKFFEGFGHGLNVLIEEGVGFVLLEGMPEGGEFCVFGFGARVVDGESSGKVLEFFELLIAIEVFIFGDGLFEEGDVFFNFGFFLE